jgi:hypothetical protein
MPASESERKPKCTFFEYVRLDRCTVNVIRKKLSKRENPHLNTPILKMAVFFKDALLVKKNNLRTMARGLMAKLKLFLFFSEMVRKIRDYIAKISCTYH